MTLLSNIFKKIMILKSTESMLISPIMSDTGLYSNVVMIDVSNAVLNTRKCLALTTTKFQSVNKLKTAYKLMRDIVLKMKNCSALVFSMIKINTRFYNLHQGSH